MPSFKVNFSDVKTFDAIVAGMYRCRVDDAEVRDSKEGEYPYINWTVSIVDGDNKGRKLWLMTSLSPKAAWKLQETLIAFGAHPDSVKGEFEIDPDDYLGAEFMAEVVVEHYGGSDRNKIDSAQPIAGGAATGGRTAAKIR